jgi:hypothetical protein
MGRAPPLPLIEGSPGQIHGVATSCEAGEYSLLLTVIGSCAPFKESGPLGVWLVASFFILLLCFRQMICQHLNTNQGSFPRPLRSSSRIVSDRLHSYNFMSIISLALSKTLGHVRIPQTILSTVKLITLLQYHRRSSKTSSNDAFYSTSQTISYLKPPGSHSTGSSWTACTFLILYSVRSEQDGSSKTSRSMSGLYICKVQVLSLFP